MIVRERSTVDEKENIGIIANRQYCSWKRRICVCSRKWQREYRDGTREHRGIQR